MPFTKVRMYEGNLPYTKPQAQQPTPQTPNVDGWRAPDQPEKVSNLQPQIYRNFDLENIYWGLQTVITPLIEKIVSNQGVKYRKVSFNIESNANTENTNVGLGYFVAPVVPEGDKGPLLTVSNLPEETSCFNAIIRITTNNQFTWGGGGSKLKVAFYENEEDANYQFNGDCSVQTASPVSTFETEFIFVNPDQPSQGGYFKGVIDNPIPLKTIDGKIYVGIISGTEDLPILGGFDVDIQLGFL